MGDSCWLINGNKPQITNIHQEQNFLKDCLEVMLRALFLHRFIFFFKLFERNIYFCYDEWFNYIIWDKTDDVCMFKTMHEREKRFADLKSTTFKLSSMTESLVCLFACLFWEIEKSYILLSSVILRKSHLRKIIYSKSCHCNTLMSGTKWNQGN